MTQKPATGNGYWAVQIGVSALFAVVGLGGAVFFFATQTEELGRGLMLGLVGIAFLALLIWLIRRFRGSTREQRAIYAWAIMQQHSSGKVDDVTAMAVAAGARDGKLSATELSDLQALRPDNPYPGTPPSSTRLASGS